MKRLSIIFMLCLLSTVLCAAPMGNAERLNEIAARQAQIIVERTQRQAIIQDQQAQINALDVEYTKLEGGKEELQRQDREAAEAKDEADQAAKDKPESP